MMPRSAAFLKKATTQSADPAFSPLKDAIRVLNGFGRSLETLLPKLKNGYIVDDSAEAQKMAAEYRHAFFLTLEGECFHNGTVTGGKPASEGPLALKRELREIDARLAGLEKNLAQAETEAAALARNIEELTAQLEARSEERRMAESETANHGAALKQMEAEAQRIERRLQDWTVASRPQQGRARSQTRHHRAKARRGCTP